MPRWPRLFSRSARPVEDRSGGERRRQTIEHLSGFATSRTGVEAYIEPATQDTPTTLILIATTGEWTRRRMPDPRAARKVAEDLGLPVYDVNLVGYPQRMRDWNSRQRRR